ncbi:DUF4287 domain-containing protein [Streptomyces sp. NPDC001781]
MKASRGADGGVFSDQSSTPPKGLTGYFPAIENGRPAAEWKNLVRTSPLTRHMERVAWLRTEHGLGRGHADAPVAHTQAEGAGR